MTDDGLPFADEAASRLTVAAALRQLRTPYRLKLTFDPDAAIAASLGELFALQRGDGGFGEYANANESDPFATASGLEALTFARAHGVRIDSDSVARAAGFMERALANPGLFKWCAGDALCKAQLRFEALWALAGQGSARTDFLADIVAQSAGFDSATQIRLARYLLRAPGWQSRGMAMAARLQQTTLPDRPLCRRERLGSLELDRFARRRAVADAATDARAPRAARTTRRRGPRARRAAMPVRLADDRRHRFGGNRADRLRGERKTYARRSDGDRWGSLDRHRPLRIDGILANLHDAGVIAAPQRAAAHRPNGRHGPLPGALHLSGAAECTRRARRVPRDSHAQRSQRDDVGA